MKIITSESVNIGHPDKTCDYIADCFLDEALRQDPASQMAVECAIKNTKLFIYGEATTKAAIDYDSIARRALKNIGYQDEFDIIKEMSCQSPDINHAVVGETLKANDQGIVYGYATNETPEYMPCPIIIAHKIMQQYDIYRRQNKDYLPDAKSQVSVVYDNAKPIAIDTILVSVSHTADLCLAKIQKDIKDNVIAPVLASYTDLDLSKVKYIINPSGKFTVWGSYGDSGCVGRKIVVDSYGGVSRVGGGCFSSKNATKVDRSGAYYARYVAKNIVAHNLADKCEIGVSYGIGLAHPLSIEINTFGTEKVSQKELNKIISHNFDFSPDNIIKELDLLRPIYAETACYGHFGREQFPWEKIIDLK